jgi:leucine dehydrogenase
MKISAIQVQSEHEAVLVGEDAALGYRGIIAIHSTVLGPAVGGTRVWSYGSFDEALTDALRLSRGMTYKTAAAGLPLGGGKSVILQDGTTDRTELFRAHGRFVHSLGGRYITAEDVGTSPQDMAVVRSETPYAAGLAELSGDPSPVTARGVFRSIEAAAMHRWGSSDLQGRQVSLQGCGQVGYHLANALSLAGARLTVADVNPAATARLVRELGARAVDPGAIHLEPADVFAPCALGGTLNQQTIPGLRCEIVAGAANNQLLEPADAGRLEAKGITYVPDYIANAGGVINGSREILGWSEERARSGVEGIFDTVLEIFQRAEREKTSTAEAADRLAESRLRNGRTAG